MSHPLNEGARLIERAVDCGMASEGEFRLVGFIFVSRYGVNYTLNEFRQTLVETEVDA